MALIAGATVLLLLMIFVLQNGQPVQITFLGFHGTIPLGVALMLAAISGVLAVAIPGTGRILQLRRAARRQHATQPPADLDRRADPQPDEADSPRTD